MTGGKPGAANVHRFLGIFLRISQVQSQVHCKSAAEDILFFLKNYKTDSQKLSPHWTSFHN